jgi:methyl-accepting chemotaxis protein
VTPEGLVSVGLMRDEELRGLREGVDETAAALIEIRDQINSVEERLLERVGSHNGTINEHSNAIQDLTREVRKLARSLGQTHALVMQALGRLTALDGGGDLRPKDIVATRTAS